MRQDETSRTQARYNRIAPIYDLMEAVVERAAFQHWRSRLWDHLEGDRVLEVGIGTGKNIPYHPTGARIIGIDISDRMLNRAQERGRQLRTDVGLVRMDAERLGFPDGAFDAAMATFVFCSVPDAVRGLQELDRVVQPGGPVILLEHVRVNAPLIGPLMDVLDPAVLRLMGPHISRRTVDNVKKAGLKLEHVEELAVGGLVKLIHARSRC